MTNHGWTAHLADGHKVGFAAAEVGSCSGAGVLRASNDADEVVLLLRNWAIAIRDDTTVTITRAPESASDSGASTGRPFA
jgi:hypothetical protein